MNHFYLAMLLVLVSLACNREPKVNPNKTVEVEYRVSSSSGAVVAKITHFNETGGMTSIEEAPLPFSVKIKFAQRPSSLAVMAMLPDQNGQPQSLTGTIVMDGQVVESETGVGTPPLVNVVYVLQ